MSSQQVAITGATGLVGGALCDLFTAHGWRVRRLVRKQPGADSDDIYWNPSAGEIDRQKLNGVDAVVHLAGENIASGRWDQAKKEVIAGSRIDGTRLIAETIAGLENKPRVLVSASAIGFYGDRGQHPVDENSPPGEGFLAETCVAWESETRPAWEAGVRVVQARIGVVISEHGGALKKMLPLFKLGLGGPLGNGRQIVSWVAMDDVVNAIKFCVENEAMHGAVNVTAPSAITNRQMSTTLARILNRPAFLPVPKFALRATTGEFADEALLASADVRPTRLAEAGYQFMHPEYESAVQAMLERF